MQSQVVLSHSPGRILRPGLQHRARVVRPGPVLQIAPPCRTRSVVVRASLTRPAGEEASGTDSGSISSGFSPFMSVPDTTMAGGAGGATPENMGSKSMLATVLERNRVNIIMPTPPHVAPKLDDGGAGGGLGKNNHNGGGGGDGGGDDDDYFGGEEGDGDGDGSGGGDGFFRLRIPELFDRLALGAVLQEWFKTIADLPLFIRRSVEMGLFSSAQLVRFLSMDVRPNMARTVSRSLPTAWAREFVGRLMADPAFAQKLVIEQALAFSASMLHEWRVRGDAFKNELDLAVINSMGMAAAVGATVWITAPSRAYGAVHKFPWQRMLADLPHCVFDASGPLHSYTAAARAGGFFASAAQLSAVGAAAGAATSAACSAAIAARRRADPSFEPSVPVPSVARASGGLGAFFALNANVRYQLLGGLDQYLFGHASALWSYIGLTAAARVAGLAVGEQSRSWWQGLATETAASHYKPRTRIRKVRRRVVRRPASGADQHQQHQQQQELLAQQQQLLLAGAGSERKAALAAIAAALAASRADEASLSSSGVGVDDAGQQQQQHGDASTSAAAALGDYAGGEESGTTSSRAAAAAAGGRGGSSLESEVEGRLAGTPALMGSPQGLSQLARQSAFSGSSMGEALRGAVSEAAA